MTPAKAKSNVCIKPPGCNPSTGYKTYGCRCTGPGSCTEGNTVGVRNWRRRAGVYSRMLVPVEDADGE